MRVVLQLYCQKCGSILKTVAGVYVTFFTTEELKTECLLCRDKTEVAVKAMVENLPWYTGKDVIIEP